MRIIAGNLNSQNVRTLTSPNKSDQWWITGLLLFSMLFEGLVIPVFGRTPNLSLFDIILPIIAVYLIARNFLGDCYSGFQDKTVLYLAIAYLMANMLSMVVNYRDVLRGFVAIKIFGFGFLAYGVLSATIRSKLALARATDSLVLWGAVIGAMLIYHFVVDWSSITGPQANYEVKDQIGIYGWARSNYLAALLVPILPVAAGDAFGSRGLKKFAMLSAVVLMGFGLLITMSKGAILSLVAGTICAGPVLYKTGLKGRHLIAFAVLIAVFYFIVPTDLLSANYDMISYRLDNPDFNRLDLWKIAWKEFLHNPILGVGPYCIYIYNRQYAIDDLYTHNFLLNALADLGLVGAVPFMLLIVTLVRKSYKSCQAAFSDPGLRWISVGLFVGLVSTLIHGLVEPTFPGREYSAVFWVCISFISLYEPGRFARLCEQ
jgi:O-antigen ligase